MSGKWSTCKRCSCKDPGTSREIGRSCAKLKSRHHGTRGYLTRIPTSAGVREIRRFGFATVADADAAARQTWDLINLAKGDTRTQQRIGDLIWEKTRRGGDLPPVEDVRRRLGLRRDPDASETFGEAWAAWLTGKRKARPSYSRSLTQIGDNWLLPVLKDIELDRLTGEHCAQVFERIADFNDEIEIAAEVGRKPSLPGDVRRRPKHVGVATQHRIFAALRGFLNFQWKRAHRIPFNPVFFVELEAEIRNAPLVWEPDQVVRFLAHAANDRLAFLWRLALLRGFRRGELCGMADCDMDAGAGTITVNAALLELGGKLVWGKPKSRAGERVVALDATTVVLGKAHRARRKREKLAAGEAWQEHGLMFCREDGTPLRPEHVSRRFNALAKDAGLPVIKLHAARHTAASLMLEAGLDVKIVQDTLGHSTSVITRDTYQHVRIQVHKDAAEKVVALLPEETAGAETGL
jgi:integrase